MEPHKTASSDVDKISMLKDRIDSEKFERELAQQAQKKALS